MEWLQQNLTSLLSILVTSVVGVILIAQIKSQRDKITNMKTVVDSMKSFIDSAKTITDLYSPEKLKSYHEFNEKMIEGKYKTLHEKQIEKLHSDISKVAVDEALQIRQDITEGFDEMSRYFLSHLANMTQRQREELISHFPKMADYFKKTLEDIDTIRMNAKNSDKDS